MRLIESKAELLQQPEGLDGLYRHIELCGRTAYKSEDKITEDSAKPFVDRMIKSKHLSVLEHSTVYLKSDNNKYDDDYFELATSPYAQTVYYDSWYYVTTNLRAIIELFPTTWCEFIDAYMCEPTEYHERRYTFKVTTSIGVSREYNRHRKLSITETSTRFCNYSKDKFDNEIKFVRPIGLNLNTGIYEIKRNYTDLEDIVGDGYIKNVSCADDDNLFLENCLNSEINYMSLIDKGWQPQQAREVLPLCTATEICYTGFSNDWKHFFDLRLFGKTGKPHPNAEYTANLMKEAAEKAGIWEDIINQPSKFD